MSTERILPPKCFPTYHSWSSLITIFFTLMFKTGILISRVALMEMSFRSLAPRTNVRTMRSLSCDSEKGLHVYENQISLNTLCHFHNLATGQTLLGFSPSFLHSPASPTTQLDINLVLLKVFQPENKTSECILLSLLKQERSCVPSHTKSCLCINLHN